MKIGGEQFDAEVMESPMPVLVEFYSTSCGVCVGLENVIMDSAMELLGRVKFCELSVDYNKTLADIFSINAVPTFVLFKEGKVIAQHQGALNKQEIINFCSKLS